MSVNLLCILRKPLIFHKSAQLYARNFNVSACSMNKALFKSGKVFNKLLGQGSKKKKYYIESFIAETPVLPGQNLKNVNGGKQSSRRIAVLNKLFMSHISELMATGNAAEVIGGLSVEISRVSMCSTFTQLNVYWLAKGNENDQIIESRLLDISASLRHELSQLRVMGEVPKIVFCKDKQLSQINEVEKILEKADFGDDYIPLSTAAYFKNDCTKLNTFGEENVDKEELQEPFPEMSQNTLNLRHDVILNKIQKSMEKSKALHRRSEIYVVTSDLENKNINPNFMSAKERKEGFEKFLLKRKILRERNIKKERQFIPEVILNKNDDNDVKYFNELEIYLKEDQDYLEEENKDRF